MAALLPHPAPWRLLACASLALLLLSACQRAGSPATAESTAPATASASIAVSAEQARALASDAWLFGLPLVYIDTQIDLTTHVAQPDATRAPLNQFVHYRQFPDASNRTVVGFNVDTLYSLASLDLSREPMVLSIPPMGERFWVMQIIDAWNNVPHAPGSRTLGGKGGTFLLAGPHWQGTAPAGMEVLRVPTQLAMIGGRTYTAGPSDYAAVHALQDQYRLVPLSQWGKPWSPPADVALKPGVIDKPVPEQVLAMDPQAFFGRLNALMVDNPPYPEDAPLLARVAPLGVGPGLKFDFNAFTPEVQQAIRDGVADAVKRMNDTPRGKDVNGWRIALDLGRYGTRYAYRAGWTFYGVGGNLVEDAVYPVAETEADGTPFDAAHRYQLRFEKGQLPPVNAFWSVTMYDKDSYLVPNPLNRFALGDRSGMKTAPDGSLTIYIQHDSPGKAQESNWLPAPAQGPFRLAMRLYAPKPEVAAGTWQPPAVRRVE